MLLIATTIPSAVAMNITIHKEKTQFDYIYNQDFVPGEFIVKLTNGTDIQSPSIDEYNEKYQVSSIEKLFRNSENTILDNIYILSVPEESDILSIVKDFTFHPNVVYAEPNYILHFDIITINLQQSIHPLINKLKSNIKTNDPFFNKQWALDNTGQIGGIPDADIDAPEAWGIETGDPDVVIAILDTGIDYNHPDLKDNIWINENEIPDNGIDDDGNAFIDDVRGWDFAFDDNDPLDHIGHGTHCAGIASAVTNNSIGVAGVCWNCKIMNIKTHVYDRDNWVKISNGIKYAADNGADVISMSFGDYKDSNLLRNACDYAYNKDIVMVSAAGNDGVCKIHYPAAYDNVIGVAGTDNKDKRYIIRTFQGSSNYGPWVDVAAPGEMIYSTMPTYYVLMNFVGYKTNYDYMSGTSMATPHVAGLAGLILSKNPGMSPDIVKAIILNNTDPYDSKKDLGTGRINAFKALNDNILPPGKPETPTGPTVGLIGKKYEYTTKAIDPKGDQIFYMWNWGNENDNWIGPFNSGDKITSYHAWPCKGNFEIRVKAKNIDGAESSWSDPLLVNLPRNKEITYLLLFRFLERFPLFEKLLNIIEWNIV